jgi:DcuC family C4-dicarboxylate transporter
MTSPDLLTTLAAVLIVIAGVGLVARQVDVRLVLLVSGVLLAALVGRPLAALDEFTRTMVKPDFVVPLCCSMGFAYVLKFTGCDTHLVRLLVAPLRRLGPLAVPAGVAVPFIVNTAIISQSSTAATVGPVLIPLLLAAGLSPARAGTALLIGASVGGELLNAGAPEVAAIAKQAVVAPLVVITRMLLPALVAGGTAALVFWWGTRLPEGFPAPARDRAPARKADEHDHEQEHEQEREQEAAVRFGPELSAQAGGETGRTNLLKAAIPLLPILLLVLDARLPRHLFPRPADPAAWKEWMPIGYAMLIGTGLALLTAPRELSRGTAVFFQGQGYAYTCIISLIVAALTFVEGLKQCGLMGLAVSALAGRGLLMVPTAVVVPGSLALLSGSGIAPSLTFIDAFLPHARDWHLDPVGLGMIAAQAAAIGRTLSPAAAVVMVCSSLAEVPPLTLLRRAAPPLLAAWLVTLALGFWLVRG